MDTPSDATGSIGLYPRRSFRIARGSQASDSTIRQARWYFRDEIVAIAAEGEPVAGFERGVSTQEDVRRWSRNASSRLLDHPPLVWIGAPDVVRRAHVTADAHEVIVGGDRMPLALVPKHPLNRSYFDESSARFFAHRETKLRGTREPARFVARTLWPEDFALPERAPLRALDQSQAVQLQLRALVRERPSGGARSAFDVCTLWQRHADAKLRDGYALALVLAGAQGDDDEAHGGHFALATGTLAHDGAIGDWLVDNFYTLDAESEKGIIGAPVPLDNYLADLNAGQAWYRPCFVLIAVLREPRAASLAQGAINRVYNQFYRHQLRYDHAAMNCTGISVDTLRTLGLDVATHVARWRALAPIALPWLLATRRSRARLAYDYATEDATRLLPEVAFEEVGAALYAVATGDSSQRGNFASMLAEDIDALALVRVPQLPSSRAWGDAPVSTLREYRSRLPARRAAMQIVPVPPRPFPKELRDDDLRAAPWRRSSVAIAVWLALLIAATLALAARFA